TVRQDGETILRLIAEGRRVPEQQWPKPLPEPWPPEATRLLRPRRRGGRRPAERLAMPAGWMLRKKTLGARVGTRYPRGPYRLPDELTGWRRELMGAELLALANPSVNEGIKAWKCCALAIAVRAGTACACMSPGTRGSPACLRTCCVCSASPSTPWTWSSAPSASWPGRIFIRCWRICRGRGTTCRCRPGRKTG